MLQKYFFIFIFFGFLAGVGHWSNHFPPANSSRWAEVKLENNNAVQLGQRRDLVEVLDRIVAYEHYYRSVYGYYTKSLDQIGFTISKSLVELYDIRVAEASSNRLLVFASSDANGKLLDLVSIDQGFQIHANFPMPSPRAEYLRNQAVKHLKLIKDHGTGGDVPEQTVFKGFFTYSFKVNFRNEKYGVALGVRPPVIGMHVELGESGVQTITTYENAVPLDPSEYPMGAEMLIKSEIEHSAAKRQHEALDRRITSISEKKSPERLLEIESIKPDISE